MHMASMRNNGNTAGHNNHHNNAEDTNKLNQEHNLAMVLGGIVMVFATCHSLRVFLAFYQVSIVQKTSLCLEQGLEAAHPGWLYVLSAINHFMLMINSSINFIIYCAVGSKFRQAIFKMVSDLHSRMSSTRSSNTQHLELPRLISNNRSLTPSFGRHGDNESNNRSPLIEMKDRIVPKQMEVVTQNNLECPIVSQLETSNGGKCKPRYVTCSVKVTNL